MQSPEWYCSIVVFWCIVCFPVIFHWISLCLKLHVACGWYSIFTYNYIYSVLKHFGCLGYYKFIFGGIHVYQPINNWFFVIQFCFYIKIIQCHVDFVWDWNIFRFDALWVNHNLQFHSSLNTFLFDLCYKCAI